MSPVTPSSSPAPSTDRTTETVSFWERVCDFFCIGGTIVFFPVLFIPSVRESFNTWCHELYNGTRVTKVTDPGNETIISAAQKAKGLGIGILGGPTRAIEDSSTISRNSSSDKSGNSVPAVTGDERLDPSPSLTPVDVPHSEGKTAERSKAPQALLLELQQASPDPSLCRYYLSLGANLDEERSRFSEGCPQSELISWLRSLAEEPLLTPEGLRKLAIDQGMGYKSANLMLSERQLSSINDGLKDSEVKIPPFFPISSVEVIFHLKKYDPKQEIFTKWQDFLDTFDPTQKASYIEASTHEDRSRIQIDLSPGGLRILEEIGGLIEQVFQDHPLDHMI